MKAQRSQSRKGSFAQADALLSADKDKEAPKEPDSAATFESGRRNKLNGTLKMSNDTEATDVSQRKLIDQESEPTLTKVDLDIVVEEVEKVEPIKRGNEENLNVRAAIIHMVGDMIQSAGVIIAAVIIYVKPDWEIADPICTFLFSILVMITTIPIFIDCMRFLMESSP